MPAANGTAINGKFIDTIDPDDPEYQKQLMRPAEIKEDVKLMEQRKRVSLILNSAAFRKELEEIVKAQQSTGFAQQDSLDALRQLQDFLLPMSKGGNSIFHKGSMPVYPVNDFRGQEAAVYTKSERLLRCKLASLYRLADTSGWSTSIFNHITVRVTRDAEHFLINPFGILYSEVTASNIVKINMKGDVLDSGSTRLGIDREGWFLHSAIHAARNDIRVVIHLHSSSAVAVSGMKNGILPICNESIVCGEVPIYSSDMAGLDGSETEEEADRKELEVIASLIQPKSRMLISKNNGIYVFAETVETAWYYAYLAQHGCSAQIYLSPLGIDQLLLPNSEMRQKTINAAEAGANKFAGEGIKWTFGELEFEAEMRKLDAQGYRTGYMYRQPILYSDKRGRNRMNEDVEIPPASSSFAAHTDEIDGAKTTPTTKLSGSTHWFNTPNSYHKEEIDEIGTPYPKKITRWIVNSGDEHQTSGLSVSIANPNQFAPQGGNPKEFRENQRKVKDRYYKDTTTAGPQSKLLEGVSYEEAMKMHEEGVSKAGGPGEHVVVVGAASKGIIQRDHRHNMVVYQSVYAPNPFDKVTDEDIDKYKDDVRRKTDPAYAAELEAEEREAAAREAAAKSSTDGHPANTAVHYTPTVEVQAHGHHHVAVKPKIMTPYAVSAPTVELEVQAHGHHHETIKAKTMEPHAVSAPTVELEVQAHGHHHETIKAKTMEPHAAEATSRPAQPVQRAESERVTDPRSHDVEELKKGASLSRSRSEKKYEPGPGTSLTVPRGAETMRSDTSGAEGGRDTDKEGKDGKEKKKKRKFKMPSFSRKSKDKDKK